MAITLVGSAGQSQNANPITVVLPAGMQADDMILILVGIWGSQAAPTSDGYTLKLVQGGSTSNTFGYWKRHDGDEPNPSFVGLKDRSAVLAMAFRGVSTDADPWDSVSAAMSEGSDSTAEVPALTTVGDGAMVVCMALWFGGLTYVSATYGNLTDGATVNRGYSGYMLLAASYGIKTVAGSIGSPVVTASGSNNWDSHSGALKPLAVAAATAHNLAMMGAGKL